MQRNKITFIGGGNVARSLAGGLIADGCRPGDFTIADPDPRQLAQLAASLGVNVDTDNRAAAAGADVIVLAVKPQDMASAAGSLRPLGGKALVITVAAGIRIADLNRWLGDEAEIIRAMPNTPALLGVGITALFAHPAIAAARRELAEAIMRAVGSVVWVEREGLLDAVTALSGTGPAYFFLLMEHMIRTGIRMGLTPESAQLLTQETAVGAARMALESSEDVATLRARVTSPGGTTEAAVRVFEQAGFGESIERAILAARDRAAGLADEFGRD
jgi:pyrroline-5-carboxylate reductase